MNLKEKTRSALVENRVGSAGEDASKSSAVEPKLEQVFTKPVEKLTDDESGSAMTVPEAIAVIESGVSTPQVSKQDEAANVTGPVANDSESALASVKGKEESEPPARNEVPTVETSAVLTTPVSREISNRNAQEKIIMNAVSALTDKQSTELARALDSKSPLYKTESELATAQNAIQLTEDLVNSGRVSSNLHESFEVIGDIVIRNTGASIWGPITGNIYVEGDGVLYLTQSAKIHGNIYANHIVCEGFVEGEIRCVKMIATPNAVLKTDIRFAEYFNPAMGADLDGTMKKDPNAMADIKMPSKKGSSKASFEKDIASLTA